MNESLHKWCKRITPLLAICCLLCTQAMATPDCPIIAANFSGLSEGTTVNNSSTGWYLNATNVSSSAIFWVKSNRFHAQELGGEGIWYSKVFSTAGYTDFQIATKITAEGDMNSSEYVKVYYKINGGAEILLDQRTGNFGTIDFVSPLLNGNNVQFVIRIYNYNNGGSQTSKYYIEDYRVFKEHGPCAGGSIAVSASAGNGGVLTCTNSSLTLSASSAASGVTYSWTGPNFTSTAQNPVINTAGTYTVVATNASGSGSATITVTENKTAPTVTATGGAMGCSASITINATSSITNSTYSWSGPGFSSTLQSPTVNTAGTYTVVVTNPANGCTTTKQVTVTAGSNTPTSFWLEDFTAANGTTNDTGATPWSIENAAAGTFSVQNNEFMASFNAANEGVWKSGVVSIAAKSNVVITLNLKSGTAGTSDFLEDDDYIRVYYKLNGGAETLFFSDVAGLNGVNNATATAVATSPSLNGNTLQIIVRLRNSSNTERYYIDNVQLTGANGGTTSVTASVTGVVTCTGTAQLSATSSGTVSAWSWTGPNGFTSSLQNPTVSAGGQYIVTATFSGGCTASASAPVTVTENKTAPDVTASGGSLACFSAININASSSLTTAQYSWSGPNSFSSTVKNPSVSVAGTYTVTVANPANGCTASQSVQVTPAFGTSANIWVEDFTAANGTVSDNGTTAWSVQAPASSVFAVNGNQFRISNMGTTSEGVWTSGAVNIAGKANVVLKTGVRSAVTGTGAMNETGDYADYVRFYYKLNNGAEVLFCEKRGAINSHSTTLTNISSAALTGSNVRIVVRARATGNDEFYFIDNVTVSAADQSDLSVVASAVGIISCNSNSVTLTATSATPGIGYSWTGPGGFASTLQNPVVTVPGIYSLTVTDPSTGCSATDTALVNTSLATVNVWAEDFPVNGVNVDNDATPWSVQAPAAAVFAVNGNQFRGSNIGTTSEGVWTSGSINIAGRSNVVITTGVRSSVTGGAVMNETGEFADYIRFYYKLNNGAEVLFSEKKGAINNHSTTLSAVSSGVLTGDSVRIVVRVRASGNDEFYYFDNMTVSATGQSDLSVVASAAGSISCTNNTVGLTAVSATPSLSYNWSGPGGFTSTVQNPVVSATGVYLLTVTNPATGCSASDTALVKGSQALPAGIAITRTSVAEAITCNINHITLLASSTTPGVTYSWTGPNNYTSPTADVFVFAGGRYTVKVTNPVSGCSDTTSYLVLENKTFPGANVTPSIAILTCTNPDITITAGATATAVKYSWTGPNSITATGQQITASTAGNYYLLVTDTLNGCTTSTTATMMENKTVPADVAINAIPANAQLTCTTANVSLTGNSSTQDVGYSWTGPLGYTSPLKSPTVNTPGTYLLTVTHYVSGCSNQAQITVTVNTDPPAGVSAFASDKLTCFTPSVNINGTSSTPGAIFSWTGPNGFTSSAPSAAVTVPGPYQLKVTNPANGCVSNAVANVMENKTKPVISVSNTGPLTCSVFDVQIMGSSSALNADYSWTGPEGFASNAQEETVFFPGDYILTVLDLDNGCSAVDTTTVLQDFSDCQRASGSTAKKAGPAAETAMQTAKVEGATTLSYRAYPNPFSNQLSIEFTTPTTASVRVAIYNAAGVCKSTLFNSKAQAGQLYKLPFDATGLPTGPYYCIIYVEGKAYPIKVISLKR